ncbi:MAG TPA: hypothetical protein VIO32_12490 [Candidatus Baltobacteraceae bacterium]
MGRTITLSALSDMLTEISVDRFQGFVRVIEAGEGRFVLSFARRGAADTALFSLIRENPSQLYAERSVAMLGDWVLDVYTSEISSRTGALVATDTEDTLHQSPFGIYPTFADWLLDDPARKQSAEEYFDRYSPLVPLPLRGVVTFQKRPTQPPVT